MENKNSSKPAKEETSARKEWQTSFLWMFPTTTEEKKERPKISLSEWQKIAEVLEVPFEEVFENEESLVFI
jgi:hypothetical protein